MTGNQDPTEGYRRNARMQEPFTAHDACKVAEYLSYVIIAASVSLVFDVGSTIHKWTVRKRGGKTTNN